MPRYCHPCGELLDEYGRCPEAPPARPEKAWKVPTSKIVALPKIGPVIPIAQTYLDDWAPFLTVLERDAETIRRPARGDRITITDLSGWSTTRTVDDVIENEDGTTTLRFEAINE